MSTIPVHGPEERWRRTVDQRGRPLKLKVGRLLKEFGYPRLEPGVGEAIEARLAQVGLHVRPALRDVTADQVIMLELQSVAGAPAAAAEPAVLTERPFSPPSAPAPAQAFERAPERTFERPPERAYERPPEPAYQPPPAPAPMPQPRPEPPPAPAPAPDDMEQSVLVRAAVEAERRVRTAYDRAAAAAAERIAGLERELVAERESTARARDERDELERRMHIERREAAARLQALAAAERTARGLLESQRTELSNLTQTVRVTTAAIAQTRETLGDVHEQVQQTAADVREALTESANDEPVVVPIADSEPQPRSFTMEDIVDEDDDVVPHDPPPAAELPAAEDDRPEPHDHAGHEHDHAGHDHADHDHFGHDPAGHDHDPDHTVSDHSDVDRGDGVRQFFEAEAPAQPAAERRGDRKSGRRAGRGRGERLRRKAAFVCAVCGRPGKTRDAAELVEAGWRVEGDVALCVTCVADDWKLAEGETVPFRSRT
jgi:hypothetical protein